MTENDQKLITLMADFTRTMNKRFDTTGPTIVDLSKFSEVELAWLGFNFLADQVTALSKKIDSMEQYNKARATSERRDGQ